MFSFRCKKTACRGFSAEDVVPEEGKKMSTSEMAVVIYFYGRTETYFVQVPEGAVPPYDNAELIKCLKALEFVDGVWRSFGKPRLNVTTFAGTQPSKSYVRTGVLDCLDRHGYKPARIAA